MNKILMEKKRQRIQCVGNILCRKKIRVKLYLVNGKEEVRGQKKHRSVIPRKSSRKKIEPYFLKEKLFICFLMHVL
jgi:hypothetical protein